METLKLTFSILFLITLIALFFSGIRWIAAKYLDDFYSQLYQKSAKLFRKILSR